MVKDTLRAELLTNLEISNESVWRNDFKYVKVYIFWKFNQYILLQEKA